jgi:hypothetical protein
MNRRSPRLELIAGLGFALAVSALCAAAARAQAVSTTTTLTAQSSESGGCSLTSVAVDVTSASDTPSGSVSIQDDAGSAPATLANAPLNSNGQASFTFALENGAHSLSAVYAGNSDFIGSASASAPVTISSQCNSTFVVSVSNMAPSTTANTLSLTPGQSGTATIFVTPSQQFVSSLTAPVFITISCSGLSDLASCTFTPENVEILPGQNAAVTSSMVMQTYAASTTSLPPAHRHGNGSIAWAFLLPGALGLSGLVWGSRRRVLLSRLSLVALVGLVTLLGTTACNPRYNYEHHGPAGNPATPAGSYTVTVTAQSSNGVNAVTHSTTFVLKVN